MGAPVIATSTAIAARPAPAPLPLALTLRPVYLDDMPRVRNAFAEGHKHAPGVDRMPWRYYKQWVVPELRAALAHPETQLLGAYAEGALCGWLAFARGRRVDTVHWVSTPFWFPVPADACHGCSESDEPGKPKRHSGECPLNPSNRTALRRRGIMTALLDAAALQERLVYTFRGAKHEHRNDGKTMDERLMPMLRARGHRGIEHVPWKEWSR